MAIDRCHYGFVDFMRQQPGRLSGGLRVFPFFPTGKRPIAAPEICSGTKSSITGAGENHRPYLIGIVAPVHRIGQFFRHARSPGIHRFRSVQRDQRNAGFHFEQDLFVTHASPHFCTAQADRPEDSSSEVAGSIAR